MEVTVHADDYNASFRDTMWLQAFPLNAQTVLHYFALSPFYDRSCNNERLKMQRLGLEQLKNLRGIEYEVLPNAAKQLPQQLFLIRKQRRSGRTQVEPLAVYYVLDGAVYQAPNIHAMLTSRLVRLACARVMCTLMPVANLTRGCAWLDRPQKKCSYRVNRAFHMLAAGVRFSPTEGYAWDFSSEDKKEPVIPSERTLRAGCRDIVRDFLTHRFGWPHLTHRTPAQAQAKVRKDGEAARTLGARGLDSHPAHEEARARDRREARSRKRGRQSRCCHRRRPTSRRRQCQTRGCRRRIRCNSQAPEDRISSPTGSKVRTKKMY